MKDRKEMSERVFSLFFFKFLSHIVLEGLRDITRNLPVYVVTEPKFKSRSSPSRVCTHMTVAFIRFVKIRGYVQAY
jgi:hypothetical protein